MPGGGSDLREVKIWNAEAGWFEGRIFLSIMQYTPGRQLIMWMNFGISAMVLLILRNE